MGIEDRRTNIESGETEAKRLEKLNDETEKEVFEQKALLRSIKLPEDCSYIKSSLENDSEEAVDSYVSAEIIDPLEKLKKNADDNENEASHDLSDLENGESAIDSMKSNEKNIHMDLDGIKADTHEKVEIVDDQTKKLAELRHQMVDAMIRADRIKNLR